eukprot:818101-Amphidinium_carterae.1
MKPHTRRGHRGMRRYASLTSFLVPVRTVENNVLKVLHLFSASDTSIANVESRVGTLFMPHPPKGSVKGSLPVLFLTLPIQLKLSKGRGREAGGQALKVRPGASHFSTQDLGRVPLGSESGL